MELNEVLNVEEREILAENEVFSIEELCKLSPKRLSLMVGEDASREIENSLMERGLNLKNSQRISLKTA